MKSLAIFLFLTIISISAFGQDIEDTQENRRTAAERYLKVTPMDSMMDDVIEKVAIQLPEEKRDEFKLFMGKYVRNYVLEDAAIQSMIKHFTTAEINALADFYSSPVGRSVIKKFGIYVADIMPVLMAELERAMSEFVAAKKRLREK